MGSRFHHKSSIFILWKKVKILWWCLLMFLNTILENRQIPMPLQWLAICLWFLASSKGSTWNTVRNCNSCQVLGKSLRNKRVLDLTFVSNAVKVPWLIFFYLQWFSRNSMHNYEFVASYKGSTVCGTLS